MNQYYTRYLLLLTFVFLSGCQPLAFSVDPSGTSTYSTPTPSWGVQTENTEHLRPTLFTEDDLNWETDNYREMTAGLNNGNEFIDGKFYADDVMGATFDIRLSTWNPNSVLGATQIVQMYSTEADAMQVGYLERERGERTGMIGTQNTIPRLNIAVETCWKASSTRIGEYQNCNFFGQHGRYMTTANMTVDGEMLTMDDWVVLVDVIQDRLIMQVERENSVGDGE